MSPLAVPQFGTSARGLAPSPATGTATIRDRCCGAAPRSSVPVYPDSRSKAETAARQIGAAPSGPWATGAVAYGPDAQLASARLWLTCTPGGSFGPTPGD